MQGNGRIDVLQNASKAVDQFTSGAANNVKTYLDEMEKTAAAKLAEQERKLQKQTGGGRQQANEALERAKRELESLRKLAERSRKEASPGDDDGSESDDDGTMQANVSRYAAAMAKGSAEAYSTILNAGRSVEEKQLKTQKEIAASTEATAKGLANLNQPTFAIPTA